jgi:DNA-binding MarR family transcriptional regulator
MVSDPTVGKVAGALHVSMGMLVRRLRQAQGEGQLTMPESSALARLDRGGPMSASALAALEQISAQSMGATLGGLEARGFVARRADPDDGRRALVSPTKAGLQALRNMRNARTAVLAQALSSGFTRAELKQLMAAAPLIERLAQSI